MINDVQGFQATITIADSRYWLQQAPEWPLESSTSQRRVTFPSRNHVFENPIVNPNDIRVIKVSTGVIITTTNWDRQIGDLSTPTFLANFPVSNLGDAFGIIWGDRADVVYPDGRHAKWDITSESRGPIKLEL